MKEIRLETTEFTKYRDSQGIPYMRFNHPTTIWSTPKLFRLHKSLVDNSVYLESIFLHHPKVDGYKLCGAYRIYDSKNGEVFYIGRTSSSCYRGVVDRITDFRTGVLAGIGQIQRQASPYENGLTFGKKYGPIAASKLSAEFVVFGAGESEVLKRKSSNLEARWLREHYEKNGKLPELNTRMEIELPDLPWGSKTLSEVNPLEMFMEVA